MASNGPQVGGSQSPTNGLADFIRNTQFHNWRMNRKDLEVKWEGNRSAYQAVVDESKVWKTNEGKDWRSRTYVKYTKQKVMAAFAQISDFLLQKGKIPFNIGASKWDELTMGQMNEADKEFAQTSMNQQKDLIDQQLFEVKADRHFVKNILSGAVYGPSNPPGIP